MFLLFCPGFVVFYLEPLILVMNFGRMMTGTIKGPKAQDPALLIIFGGQYG
jgi:hypothetical protein